MLIVLSCLDLAEHVLTLNRSQVSPSAARPHLTHTQALADNIFIEYLYCLLYDMWTTLVHPDRSVQKTQRTFISLRARECSSWTVMVRLLLAAGLLLAPLAFTHVASSITNEDPYFCYPGNDCCDHEPECSDLCRPFPNQDDFCGCNVAALTLQPSLHPYVLGLTNNGRPQPHGGPGPGTPIKNSAGQYVLINSDTFIPRCVGFEDKPEIVIVDTDSEDYASEDDYAKCLHGYSNNGRFLYLPPARHGFGSHSYPDKKPHIKYPSPIRDPGTYSSGQEYRGYHGHENEQYLPGLEQPKLTPAGIAGSYYPKEDLYVQLDNGYHYLLLDEKLFNLLSHVLQGPSQYDSGFGQLSRDGKLFPPGVQPGYDEQYNKFLPKLDMPRPGSVLQYGYEQFTPNPKFPISPSHNFGGSGYETDDEVDVIIFSGNVGDQHEQRLYPNRDAFKHSSTTDVRNEHSENTPQFLPGQNNNEEDSPPHIVGVVAPPGMRYEPYRGHVVSKNPSQDILKTGYPMHHGGVSLGHLPGHKTEYGGARSKENGPNKHSPKGVSIQPSLEGDHVQRGENIPYSQSGYQTNVGYKPPTQHTTETTQIGSGIQPEHPNVFTNSNEGPNVPTVLSPNDALTKHMGFGYEQSNKDQGISNSPSPNVGHARPGHRHSTDHKPKNDQPCHEQNVSNIHLHNKFHAKHGVEHENTQSFPNQNEEPLSFPTGSQHDFVIEEPHSTIQDDHTSKTAPLYENNDNHLPKSQTKFLFPGSLLNANRPSTNHGLGYIQRQRHPTEEPSKLPPPVDVDVHTVHSSWSKGGVGSTKPGHDGLTAKYEAGATKDTPWAAETEVEEQTIKIFDGCSVSYSQLQDIISSFKSPHECVLTVPPIFSGRLDQYAHIVECFPASMDVSDAFVLLANDMIVPLDCYKHIASVYARDLPLFQECSGEVLDDGQFVDLATIAYILAYSKSPECRLILTNNNFVLPFDTYKNYINRISPEDISTLSVVLPGSKKPIPYGIYKQVFDKYVDRLQKDCVLDKSKTIKLLGSKTKLSLEQFMAVLNNCHALKDATVTLPSKKTLPLVSFIPLAQVLGDDYTKCCLVSIPNTPHALSFTVVREIFKLYLEKRTFDLSKDTDVNWKFEFKGNHRQYNPADVEIFSTLDQESHNNYHKEPTTGLRCPHFQDDHYLLCRPHHLPSCQYCNEAGKPESHSSNHHRPGCAEPVYGCERFEKYVPK